MHKYTILVQRKDKSGRWRELASWQVTTDEEDMEGPLRAGLKDNYRIIINREPSSQEKPHGGAKAPGESVPPGTTGHS